MAFKQNTLKRFVNKIGVHKSTECWEWMGAKRGGYGLLWVNGVNEEAHRVSYSLFKEVPSNKFMVLHSCDNRKCVNPNHLFLGTHQDNMDDMSKKGRAKRGSGNNKAKLNEDAVKQIRIDLDGGTSGISLSRKYKVSTSVISCIKIRKTWKHVQ